MLTTRHSVGLDLLWDVPAEIWLNVFDLCQANVAEKPTIYGILFRQTNVPKSSPLSNISLVCKRFRDWSIPILYRQVHYKTTKSVSSAAQVTVGHLTRYFPYSQSSEGVTINHALEVSQKPFGCQYVRECHLQSISTAEVVLLTLHGMGFARLLALHCSWMTVDDSIFSLLVALPALTELGIRHCTFIPPSSARDRIRLTTVMLIGINTGTSQLDMPVLYSILCTPVLKSLVVGLQGFLAADIDALQTNIAPNSLTSLDLETGRIDWEALVRFLANQHTLQNFTMFGDTQKLRSGELDKIRLPLEACPMLHSIRAPLHILECLVPGRPISSARGFFSSHSRELTTRALQAIVKSSVPLRILWLQGQVDAHLASSILNLFPSLEQLVIETANDIAEGSMEDFGAVVTQSQALRSLRLYHALLVSHYRPLSSDIAMQRARVLQWGQDCSTLRCVQFNRVEFIWVDKNEWVGYEVQGGYEMWTWHQSWDRPLLDDDLQDEEDLPPVRLK